MTDTSPENSAYLGTGPDWNTTGQTQMPEAIPVHIASSNAKPVRSAAPEYGDTMTWSVDTFVNMGRPLMILPRRYRRSKAKIYVASLGGPILAGSELSQEFEGTVTSPGANANVVNVGAGAIPVGTYQVQWVVELDGTVSATDVDNFKLIINGLTVLNSVNDGAIGRYPQPNVTVTITGSGAQSVKAVAAGTVGAQYSAQLVFTPVLAPTSALIINSRLEPLMQAVPQGFTIAESPYQLEWENQKPCYAVLVPGGTGPINVSVLDQAYEET